jgi:hypothetical protein
MVDRTAAATGTAAAMAEIAALRQKLAAAAARIQEEMGRPDRGTAQSARSRLRALRELLNNGDRDDEDELVASYRALGKAIVKNKPMTRKDRTRVAKYLREAGWEDPIGTAAA